MPIVLGLDICENAVSAAMVKRGVKSARLVFQKRMPLLEENRGCFPDLARALSGLKSALPAAPDFVFASIPSSFASYRVLDAPFTNSRKIRRILPFELEPTLATPVSDLTVEFALVEGDGAPRILAAAIDRDALASFLDILSNAGLGPSSVSPSGHAAARRICFLDKARKQALAVHADAVGCTFHGIVSGNISFVRAFATPSSRPARFESIAQNIRRTIAASEDRPGREFFPERIWVHGACDDAFELGKHLKRRMDVPVENLQPSMLIGDVPLSIGGETFSPALDNALALALSENGGPDALDFRKGDFAADGKWRDCRRSLVGTGVLAASAAILFFGLIFYQNRVLENRLDELNGRMTRVFTSTFPGVARIVDPYQQMKIRVARAGEETRVPDYWRRTARAIDVLNEISKRIAPDADMEIERLVIGPEDMRFSGTAKTFETVNEIQKNLEPAPFFKKVTISSANQDRNGDRVQFNIKADF